MKLSEAQTKLEELKAVAEPTEEQKSELTSLEGFVVEETKQKSRFDELSKKDENVLTSEEVDEYLTLAEKFEADKKIDGKAEPEAAKKKYAGIYETLEALLDGIMSSETERKRITDECKADPLLAEALEAIYKDSQRVVTKVVEVKKSRPGPKPLEERLFHEMPKEEWEAWEKKDKLAATAWLGSAKTLNDAQAKSGTAVFKKHPEFYAMQRGVVEPSKEYQRFLEVEKEHPEWVKEPDAAEKILAEAEKVVPAKKEPEKKPVPVKREEKPDFAQGKGSASVKKSGRKLTTEEFEKLSDAEQRAYQEGSVVL